VGPSADLGLMGTQNPSSSVFIIRPINPANQFVVTPSGFPFSRETVPFTDEPHRDNNLLFGLGTGAPVRQFWVPPRPVVMQVYVPVPGEITPKYQTMVAEAPGFYVTQTTTGYIYPERWVVDQLNVGVYQWRKAPALFVPR
jgi:hypothetical protein